jgi:formate hydrogenlyase transcriptional activator
MQPKTQSIEEIASPSAIEERLRFETMLADLSTRFVNLPANRIDAEIEKSLKLISNTLNIDRCSVAQLSVDRTELKVTHGYAIPGIPTMPDLILSAQQPFYSNKLFKCESIVLSNTENLPEEAAAEKEFCRQQGIKSLVLIPLVVSDSFLGVVGFSCFNSERDWQEMLVQRLCLVGVVFANALMRKRSEQKLHEAFNEINELKDQLEADNSYLREEIYVHNSYDDFIGSSEIIKTVLHRVHQVSNTDSSVLLLGETGTGKELLAQAIHNSSPRRNRPMITVNCAALPMNLVESELFGHEKGAFTGAQTRRIGRFELANGSSLFLDEIGELSMELQVKLLRVLQTKQFERLGGQETIASDVRIIAATNRDLLHLVNSGQFRMDLYYRLNVFPIVVPPLRNRVEDIPELVWFFVREFNEKMGKRIRNISRGTMQNLQNYAWPGNIRELRNIIERAVIISSDNALEIEWFEHQTTEGCQPKTLYDVERRHILEILKSTGWKVRGKDGAAEILDLKPTTLEAKMAKLSITRPRSKSRAKPD